MTQRTSIDWNQYREIALLRDSGHPAEALAKFQHIADACSDDEERAQVFLDESICYRDLGRLAEMVESASSAVELLPLESPLRPFAEFSLACAHQLEGDLEHSAEGLRTLLQKHAEFLATDDLSYLRRDAQHRLAAVLIMLGNGTESLFWLEMLQAESASAEETAELQYREAKANTLLGRQGRALELFQMALAGPLDSQFVARAHFGVGEILFNQSEFGRAISEFEEATRLTGKDSPDHEAFTNWLHATRKALKKP